MDSHIRSSASLNFLSVKALRRSSEGSSYSKLSELQDLVLKYMCKMYTALTNNLAASTFLSNGLQHRHPILGQYSAGIFYNTPHTAQSVTFPLIHLVLLPLKIMPHCVIL